MKLDGTYESLWEAHRHKIATNDCALDDQNDNSLEQEKLGVKNVAGIFLTHILATIIAFGFAIFSRIKAGMNESKDNDETENDGNNAPTFDANFDAATMEFSLQNLEQPANTPGVRSPGVRSSVLRSSTRAPNGIWFEIERLNREQARLMAQMKADMEMQQGKIRQQP